MRCDLSCLPGYQAAAAAFIDPPTPRLPMNRALGMNEYGGAAAVFTGAVYSSHPCQLPDSGSYYDAVCVCIQRDVDMKTRDLLIGDC